MNSSEDSISFVGLEARKRLKKISKVLLVGSGKGGVGKSFFSTLLGLSLSKKGYATALLDLDIHGSSIPNYLEIRPPLKSSKDGLEPKIVEKLKMMSVALMTGDRDVPMRGAEKHALITQLFASTNWGKQDYLVVDLPPGTGDEVLSAFSLFGSKAHLILVTTPSPNAVRIVSRLRNLASTERIPVIGIVVNMCCMIVGKARIYPFGRVHLRALEKEINCRVLGEIPIDASVNSLSLTRVFETKGGLIPNAIDRIVKGLIYDDISQ